VTNATGSLFLALVLAMLVVGFVGIASYRIIYRPLLSRPPLIALIASIGVFIASEELFRLIFGPFSISYQTTPLQSQIDILPGIMLSEARIMVVVLAFVLLLGVNWLSRRTRLGIAARASVVDPGMAMSSGVNVETIRYAIFFIGSAFAAAAGVMVSLLNNLVEPTMGAVPSYKALAIIVLGGLGSVRGALIASLLLGVIETFGTIYLDDILDRDSIAFAFLILVLMIRPKGIFTKG
jgi:branched-chain amino acid transport system permease protein